MVSTKVEKTCPACFLEIFADSDSFATNSVLVMVPPFCVFNILARFIRHIDQE